MTDEPEIPFSLEQLYQAIERYIHTHLPGVQTVAVWPNIEDRICLPAVFIELAEMEPGQDPGTGEMGLACKFEARVITDPIQPDHHQQAVFLAGQLAVLLRLQSWGVAVEPAEFVQAMQDWTKPELDGYTVWVVEWTQQIYLGETDWPWADQPPGTLVLNIEPGDGVFRPEEVP
ncbi:MULTISPECIES: hypothetical protein [Pseudomonas]|uniref:Phage protein n=1 Tax=Pseudomonas wuhanensis TaxID=2954098 RepID=A0ABY9GX58_9PSED|nr:MULTISPECIES: hypothetical protein [unclassified Pseudomonas]WLI14339.1 hypothetical protein PSH65_09550 [Pseudomonas sp. FP603]WLI20255.1 hypothetical protein PSH88_09570 [Pseudomonas sp. FP607]